MHGDILPALCKYCPSSDNGNPILDNLAARVTFLEEFDQPIDRHIRTEVQQLKAANLYFQRQIKELQIKKKKGAKYE